MALPMKPTQKPDNPNFSCGPCSKRPGWTPAVLADAALGRSHRSKIAKAKLAEVIELSKALLDIPEDYQLGIVPASDTGAFEMALWSLLGSRTVDVYAWEAFSTDWLNDIAKQLKIPHHPYSADYGQLPDLQQYNSENDSVFAFNGTTSGVRLPHTAWISDDRTGLTICDATSAVFSQHVDFSKLDVTTWSWQKALGSEAAHGMIALSPRAAERLQTHQPGWPMPKIFTMSKNGKLIEGIFRGETINTPSLLCVEDVLDSMKWVQSIGGQKACQAISDKNLAIISAWVEKTDWIDFLVQDSSTRSNTSICLSISDSHFTQLSDAAQRATIKQLCALLEIEQAAFDINAYRSAPPGLRIWGGATVEPHNIKALLPWLEWGFAEVMSD